MYERSFIDSNPNFKIQHQSCCRIETLMANAEHYYRVSTRVVTAAFLNGESGPLVNTIPMQTIPQNSINSFSVAAIDVEDGTDLSFAWSSSREMNYMRWQDSVNGDHWGITLNGNNGLMSWDTNGVEQGLYQLGVTVADSSGARTMVDFLVQVTPPLSNFCSPNCAYTSGLSCVSDADCAHDMCPAVTAECVEDTVPLFDNLDSQTVDAGSTLEFTVTAEDPNPSALLQITASNLPGSASLDDDSETKGWKCARRFSWTPTNEDAGTTVVQFKVENPGEGSDTMDVFITVVYNNNAPTAITLNGGAGNTRNADGSSAGYAGNYCYADGTCHVLVPENARPGTVVGYLSTDDEDASDEHVYALVDDAGGLFTIAEGNQLVVAAPADFEGLPSSSAPYVGVRVTSSDPEGESVSASFDIEIVDVNEPPTDLFLSHAEVAENAPIGTLVGEVTIEDPDADGAFPAAALFCTMGCGGGRFRLDGSSLVTNAPLDFEQLQRHLLRVLVWDRGEGVGRGMWIYRLFTIAVTDVNEVPGETLISPVDAQGRAFVDENSPGGTVVGTLTSTDPDEGQSHTFDLIEGQGDDVFEIDGALLVLADGASLDYEDTNVYYVGITATDSEGLSSDSFLTIAVENVAEPPLVEDTQLSVMEDSPKGTYVGTLEASTSAGFAATEDGSLLFAVVGGDGEGQVRAGVIVTEASR